MAKSTITKSEILGKLGNLVKVSNLTNSNYNKVANQFEIIFENGKVFQSYAALVAVWMGGKWYFSEYYHDYSRTTAKHCTSYCGYSTNERRQLMNSGEAFTIVE